MFTIYALFFKRIIRVYVGMTCDYAQRIKDHRKGKTRSTKNRGEFISEIIEKCSSREDARDRERYWKSGCGKEQLRKKYKKYIAGWSSGSSSGS